MTSKSLLFTVTFLFTFCLNAQSVKVNTETELSDAIQKAVPGTDIIMANGQWKDLQIKFSGKGTKEQPITLRAEEAGKVSLEGHSSLQLGGEYLVVKDLYFKNGYTPLDAVIEYKIDDKNIANHSRVTNCVIENYTQPNRSISDLWVLFWGRHNKLDHSYLAGKFNEGPTLRVALKGNEHIKNYHQITNNYFGPRPRKGGPKAETIQIGSSQTSMAPSYVNVSNNLFDQCNGEVEVISNKSSFNEFRNNIFYKSEGSLVLRHGNYCTIDGNIFIGDGDSPYYGGVRVINTGHWVTNNYFYDLQGDEFRSPLAIMNGIPKSPLNRYNQVTDVVVAHNTWINSATPWQLSVGANNDKDDILPAQEIRSARPQRIVIANNLVYNENENDLLKSYDKVDGVTFKKNVINDKVNPDGVSEGVEVKDISINKIGEFIFLPSENQNVLEDVYPGFEFETIDKDIFGQAREGNNLIGAFSKNPDSNTQIEFNSYGPKWFVSQLNQKEVTSPKIIQLKKGEDLAKTITLAEDNDTIELADAKFKLASSLLIDKNLTIRSANPGKKAKIKFEGASGFPAFQLGPKANLSLKNLIIEGDEKGAAFATLEDNMFAGYNLSIKGSAIKDFNILLKAYKRSFADEIFISDSNFEDFQQGILLHAETDDLGDYNAEFVKIENSTFKDIEKNVINFYRGGYDESTIGGNLFIQNSSFIDCGEKEDENILIKNRGIVNVELIDNKFQDNPVEVISVLWGEMGNIDRNNTIENSGKIITEKYLKQKLVY